jgi:pimeloyl-ACP methyl ester carboxylesterase
MAEPVLAATRLAGTATNGNLLVVGPSLGTAVETLWETCAAQLAGQFEVVGWDLPGHGASPPTAERFTVIELAEVVRALASAAAGGRAVLYAGVSLGGAVAFEIGLKPGPFQAVAAIASASRIGEPPLWRERAETVRSAGTPVLEASASVRWFGPGFAERDGVTPKRLLRTLSGADDESYSLACEALAGFDRRPDLARITLPFLLGPGEQDGVVPPARAQEDADAIAGSRLQTFADCGHLPPAEAPAAVADTLTEFFASIREGDDPGRPSPATKTFSTTRLTDDV